MTRALLAVLSLLFGVTSVAPRPATAGTPLDACSGAEVPDPATAEKGPLRFGVTAAGLVFTTQQPVTPEDIEKNVSAVHELSRKRDFVIRLNRFFFSEGDEGIERFAALAKTYSRQGFEVTLQLRYGGPESKVPGTPEEFASWVRDVVAELGRNRRVVGVEVVNEPNYETAPDNSDGGHEGVIDALVLGVIAAHDEKTKRNFHHLSIGFDWFHHTGADAEAEFWSDLSEKAGPAFAKSLDFIGLNAYPGTYDAFVSVPGKEDDEILKALSALRDCFLPLTGVAEEVPIRVTEVGFPNGVARSEQDMGAAMNRMVTAVAAHAKSYNVTDLYWFTLRDTGGADKPANEWHYGILKHDYSKKVAFATYQSLIGKFSAP